VNVPNRFVRPRASIRAGFGGSSAALGERGWAGESGVRIAPTRYNLGVARGYQSFARPTAPALSPALSDASIPDLADFRPSPGVVTKWIPPGGPGVRIDSHVFQGYRVPPTYDSMVAKLLVHAPTRPEAIARAKRALGEFVVEGIHTTIPLHLKLLRDSPFKDGAVDTKYLERTMFPAGE